MGPLLRSYVLGPCRECLEGIPRFWCSHSHLLRAAGGPMGCSRRETRGWRPPFLEYKVSTASQVPSGGAQARRLKDERRGHPLCLGILCQGPQPGMGHQWVSVATCCRWVGGAKWKEAPASCDLLNSLHQQPSQQLPSIPM